MAAPGWQAAGAVAVAGAPARAAASRPQAPSGSEVVLWEGRPAPGGRRWRELVVMLAVGGVLTWGAVLLTLPHFAGSPFAGSPDASSMPLVLAMLAGTLVILAVPVFLVGATRARSRYTLTNRRALIWLGRSIAGEAVLFGADMRVEGSRLSFATSQIWLHWRLHAEGPDRLHFEGLADPLEPARVAEAQGARWLDRPPEADDDPPPDQPETAA